MGSEWFDKLKREWPGEWSELLTVDPEWHSAEASFGPVAVRVHDVEGFRRFELLDGYEEGPFDSETCYRVSWAEVRSDVALCIRQRAESFEKHAAAMNAACLDLLNMKPSEGA